MAEYTSAERSRNAKAQARDRNGRWIKQGGTVSWRQRVTGEMKTGLVVGVTGNYALVIPKLNNPTQMPQPFMLPVKSIGSATGVKATLDRRDKKTIEAEKKYLAQLQAKFNSQQNGTTTGTEDKEAKRKRIDADWDARRKKWDAQRKQRDMERRARWAEQDARRKKQDAERRARWAEQDARQAKQDKRRAQQKVEREKERAQRKADQKEQDARRAKQRAERAQDRKQRDQDRKQREADRLQRKSDQAESDKRRAKQRAERAADRAQRLADRAQERKQRAQDRATRLKEQAQDRARTLRQRAEDDAYRDKKASRQGGLRDDEVDKSSTTKAMSGYQSSLSKRIASGQSSSFKWRGLTTQVTPTKNGSRVSVHDSHGNLVDSYDFSGKDADGQANGVANKIRDLIANKASEEYIVDLNRDGVPDADQKSVRIPEDQEFSTTKVTKTRAHQYKPGTTMKSGDKLYTKTGKMTTDNQKDGLWSSYTKQKDGSYSLDKNKDGTSRYVRSSALGGDTYDVSEALPKSGHDDPSDDISLEDGNSFNMTDEEFEKMLEEFHGNLSKSR